MEVENEWVAINSGVVCVFYLAISVHPTHRSLYSLFPLLSWCRPNRRPTRIEFHTIRVVGFTLVLNAHAVPPSLNSSGISRRKACVDASIDTVRCDINEPDDRTFQRAFYAPCVAQHHLQENKPTTTSFYSLTKMSEFFNRFTTLYNLQNCEKRPSQSSSRPLVLFQTRT